MGGDLGSVVGAGLSYETNQNAQQAALNATQTAVNTINSIGAPPDLAKQIVLQQYQQAGVLTPQLEQAVQAHFQQIQGVSAPVQQAQAQALQQMSQVAQTGLNSQDRLALSQLQQQTAKANAAAQNDITQGMQQRGQLGAGSGAEIALKEQAAQQAQNQLNQGTLGVAAQAQNRALQAITGLGNLSAQQSGQQFNQNAQQAAIANEQNRFNVANQQAVQNQNVTLQNQAQAANLAQQQAIANQNTSQANQEALREVNAQQQMYQDTMDQKQAAANALIDQGTQIAGFGAATGAAQGNIASGGGNLGQGAYNYFSAGSGGTGAGATGSTAGSEFGGSTAGASDLGGASYGTDAAAGGLSGGDAALLAWQGGEIPDKSEMGYAFGGEVMKEQKPGKHFDVTELKGKDIMQLLAAHKASLQTSFQPNEDEENCGYANGGMVFHANGQPKHPKFPSTPTNHPLNPSMFTQHPQEYCGGGEVGYSNGGTIGTLSNHQFSPNGRPGQHAHNTNLLPTEQEYAKGGLVQEDLHGRKVLKRELHPNEFKQEMDKIAGKVDPKIVAQARMPQRVPMTARPMMPPPGQPMGQMGQSLPPAAPMPPVNMQHGGFVKGPEIVPGSSPANDVIRARLSSGEYVVPKEDAPSMELIHQILKGMKAKKKN